MNNSTDRLGEIIIYNLKTCDVLIMNGLIFLDLITCTVDVKSCAIYNHTLHKLYSCNLSVDNERSMSLS